MQRIIERAKGILLSPRAEWDKVDEEVTEPKSIITGYALPLIALEAIAGLIGKSVLGFSLLGAKYGDLLFIEVISVLIKIAWGVASIFVFAFIINARAPILGAAKNWDQAFKVAAYTLTAAWVAGLLKIIPALGTIADIGALYSLYLLFVGLPKLMKPPAEKAIFYTIATIGAIIVASFVIAQIISIVLL